LYGILYLLTKENFFNDIRINQNIINKENDEFNGKLPAKVEKKYIANRYLKDHGKSTSREQYF